MTFCPRMAPGRTEKLAAEVLGFSKVFPPDFVCIYVYVCVEHSNVVAGASQRH